MSVNSKMTAIADAIRGKTGKTDSLTLDQMAAEIAGIETGGGGSMESGELTTTSAQYWGFTIPVSSKKTHVLVYPKSVTDMIANNDTTRARLVFATDGDGKVEVSPANGPSADGRSQGNSYWFASTHGTYGVAFNDDSIAFTAFYGVWAIGDYYWIAW